METIKYMLMVFSEQINFGLFVCIGMQFFAIFINHQTDGETVTTLSARLEVIITRRTK